MVHRNAPLTETGRLRLARCVVDDGWPLRRAAERFQVSPTTAARWAARYRQAGPAGMADRSSRPHASPARTPQRTERRVVGLRVARRLGPARIACQLGLHASTVHAILVRYGCPRLAYLDRAAGLPVRRYERDRPGELVHIDVKKLGNIPDGGGHRVLDRAAGKHNRQAHRDPARRRRSPAARTWAMPACTPPSTTTPAWPIPRSCPTRPARPPPRSSPAPPPGTPPPGSPSSASSPTTAPATGPGCGPPPAPAWASPPSAPGPTGPRPTARSSASTAPSPTNGPTPAPTTQKPNGAPPLTPGSTPTTITGDTPHSKDSRPPAASLTSQVSTPRRAAGIGFQIRRSVPRAPATWTLAGWPARTVLAGSRRLPLVVQRCTATIRPPQHGPGPCAACVELICPR